MTADARAGTDGAANGAAGAADDAARMGSRPQHELADLPALADREGVLADLGRVIADAWASFDSPRPTEPELDPELAARFAAPLPEPAGDAEAALADAAHVLDASVSPSRPLFLAYIGSTGLEIGVLASALAATYDANLATSAGGADLVEAQALRWVAEFVGFPHAEGAFTSGGMTSNLTALLAARERALPGARSEGVGARRAAVYCSDEAHHSVVRAVETCGLGSASVRRIPIDGQRRMRVDALERALAGDIADGVVPVAVVATAGTTLTGAVDPLDAIADACERHGVWLHVDGAYGLPAAAAPSAAAAFAGLQRADSATLDAHKWLGLQKSCSVVLAARAGPAAGGVRPRGALHAARGRRGEPRRPHARVLAPAALAAPVDGVPRPRRRAVPGLDRAHARQRAAADRARPRRPGVRAASTSRCSPRSASATSRPASATSTRTTSPSPARCSATAASSSRPPPSTAARACARASSTSARRRTRCRRWWRSRASWATGWRRAERRRDAPRHLRADELARVARCTSHGPADDLRPGARVSADAATFDALADRHRRELHIHCYRMLGSFDEAEDAVQETFLRAWRSREKAEPGPGLRAWLYRIATNVSLDALRRRKRRDVDVRTPADLPFLQPYPDRLLDEVAPREDEPDALLVERETIELAYIALIQLLPPRQRAVLLMREVLGWSAAETATLLETSVASVNSALQRARATLDEHQPARESAARPAGAELDAAERELLRSFIDMHERADADGAVALMREDIRVTMPPHPMVFEGIKAVLPLITEGLPRPATGGSSPRARTGCPRPRAICAHTATTRSAPSSSTCCASTDGRIAEITTFGAELFPAFGLPPTLP